MVSNPYLLVGGTGIVVLIAIGLARRRYIQRTRAFKQLLEQHRRSGLALVRYVMLNRQCSEESAHQRIATFVKLRSPLEDRRIIDELLLNNMQSLLDKAGKMLLQHPEEIEKI